MLKQLTIRNYALIRHLEMLPAGGLNVITGETGAGKTIMLGALGLLLGNRADTKVLWDTSEKCVTEAEFDISFYGLNELFRSEDVDFEDRTILRREISASGKSRAFINDTPVTLDTLKRIGSRLMDIHSQHETLELGRRTFQLQLIDAYGHNASLAVDYGAAWDGFVNAREKHENLLREAAALQKESEFIRFQLDELVKAGLSDKEQEELESELKIQEHAEEIKSRLNATLKSLDGSDFAVRPVLADIKNQLGAVSAFSSGYEQLFKRVDSLKIELDDILHEIEREEGKVAFDQQRLDEVNGRLSMIYQLLQKHRARNITELISIQGGFQEKADQLTNLDGLLADSKQQLEVAEKLMGHKAVVLSQARLKVFGPLTKQITQLLKELGIPEAQIKVEHEDTSPGPTGKDSIEILFSANKGIPPRPLAQVASGGEFSRLMFCVKHVMAEKMAMPTLVLDEIDTGVSGEIAISLGKLMKEMSRRHQVIAISHLPQIAAKGDAHYFVYKDNSAQKTVSTIKKLNDHERIEEIAKMIGGASPSVSAMENARELINK